jgi:Bacterial PH domain
MASAVLQFSMERGERQLWAGAPRQGIMLRAADGFAIPFSLLWGGFAIFWVVSVLRSGARFFWLFGLPFVGIGFYITIGRFLADARRRARTSYIVTSNRIVLIRGARTPVTTSLLLTTLSNVTMTERPDGTGTINFGIMDPRIQMYANMSFPGMPQLASFESIPDVRTVYNIIQSAQQDALAHRST